MTWSESDVAVVIPLYNGERWIDHTLASVFAQTHLPAEVVVVDDGSTDEGPAIVRSHARARLVRNSSKGANPARRYGAELTTAPLITFLDQDDLWHEAHLQLLTRILRDRPDAAAALAASVQFQDDTRPTFGPPVFRAEAVDPAATFPLSMLSTPSQMVIRRHALERCGGWPTRFPGVADYYLTYRLAMTTPGGILRNAAGCVGRRLHETSLSTELRGRKASGYLGTMHHAAADVLHRRLAMDRTDEAVLTQRLDVLVVMQSIAQALETDDMPFLTRQACRLRRLCDEATPVWAEHAAWTLYWFLWPLLMRRTPAAVEGGRILVDAWPDAAGGSKTALQSLVEET